MRGSISTWSRSQRWSSRKMAEIRWVPPAPVDVPEALRRAVGGHDLVATILARRGFTDPDAAKAFLDPAALSL